MAKSMFLTSRCPMKHIPVLVIRLTKLHSINDVFPSPSNTSNLKIYANHVITSMSSCKNYCQNLSPNVMSIKYKMGIIFLSR